MKKLVLMAIGTAMVTCLSAQVNKVETQLPKTILKFSPQHLIRGGLWISGEFFNSDYKNAHQLSLEFMYRQPNSVGYGVTKGTGITGEYAFKHYLNRLHIEKTLGGKETINGYYVGIFAQGGYYKEQSRYYVYSPSSPAQTTELTNEVTTTAVYPGFIIGRQQSLGESFFVDFYVGAGMRVSESKVKKPDENFDYKQSPDAYSLYHSGLLPKIGMSIGFGF
jgi:hypothetical protein